MNQLLTRKSQAIAFWLLLASIPLAITGVMLSTAGAPCSTVGAVVSVVAALFAAAATGILATRAIRLKSMKEGAFAIISFAVVAAIALVSYVWTMLLCRGI